MTTAVAPDTSRRTGWALPGALLGASLLGMSFAVVALVGYPAPATQEALYWVAVVLLGGCAVLAWVSARVPALQVPTIRRLSILFGVLCGACWIVEMVTANLVRVPTGDGLTAYLIVYRGAILLGFALPLVAGFVATRATGQIRAGISVSFWSGLICGLIGYLTLMFLTYAFLGTFEHDPQTLNQFAQSHRQQPGLSLDVFISSRGVKTPGLSHGDETPRAVRRSRQPDTKRPGVRYLRSTAGPAGRTRVEVASGHDMTV